MDIFFFYTVWDSRIMSTPVPVKHAPLPLGKAQKTDKIGILFKSKPVQPGRAVLSLPVPGEQLHAHGSAGT